jgi:pimeloyl-ACP methyl ester carboxylesterase
LLENRAETFIVTVLQTKETDMDLHYEVQGKGEAVVLIHSGGADLRDWEFIAPQLAQTYQVIAFDGRGAGQSPPLLEPANFVEDLRQLLDHLNLDRVILVGHSIGGQIATDFALAYPDRVTRLVLVAPDCRASSSHPMFNNGTRKFRQRLQIWKKWLS